MRKNLMRAGRHVPSQAALSNCVLKASVEAPAGSNTAFQRVDVLKPHRALLTETRYSRHDRPRLIAPR